MKLFSRHTYAALAVALAAALPTHAAADKPQTWRVQSLWQSGTVTQLAFERWAKDVATKTNGKIKVTALPTGAVVGPNETFDAVARGILNGQHPATVYWSGKNPAFAVLGDLSAAYDDPKLAHEYFYEHGGLELLREAYKPYGLYPIGAVWWGAEALPTTRKVASPEQLAGLKIRLPQGMSSDLFASFKAVPINLPGSEVFSALDSGTIESTDWGTLSMNDELGFHDIAKYVIYPGIHSTPTGDVSIPLKVWNKLDAETQKILEQSVKEFGADLAKVLQEADGAVAQKLAARGVQIVDWSQEDRKKFRTAAIKVWHKYGEQNDLSRRAVEGQVAFLRSKGLID
ncbi:TRAP transporter substrate-binding protein [Candidimonas sp. SYP-B2681]|uniref:TRAP transporter substrate-binding protein n=1 Tax=Candidimonas sp. SYP-B2681 TaxID=2497686 RepID=UPI000F880629|nr:TRAP transporter substrate-binding protein [Candidimonas sp. SYP-B2681]RTZ48117.1 TRAP transporter substrate-binding protein [Candidimonas sp. SYP-B2681]